MPTYPVGSNLVVRDLVPYVRKWSTHEELALTLKPIEVTKFQEGGTHLRQYVVQSSQKLPTALHSWGGQVLPCACGCRINGFCSGLLRDKGIYAQIVAIPCEGYDTTYRYLHAIEVCILCGVPPIQKWGDDQRLNLAAVGQMAAPMHAIWIASSIKRHMQILLSWDQPDEPLDALHELKKQVWAESRTFYPEIPKQVTAVESQPHDIIMCDGSGVSWNVRVQPGAVVQQLVAAECDLHFLGASEVAILDAEHAMPLDSAMELSQVFAVTVNRNHMPCHHEQIGLVETPVAMDLDLTVEDANVKPTDASIAPLVSMPDVQQSALALSAPVIPDAELASVLCLHGAQFTALIPPLVSDVDLCASMKGKCITSHARMQLLKQQGDVWGDDEIAWHMDELVRSSCTTNTVILDPLLATCWTTAGTHESVKAWWSQCERVDVTRVVSVVLLEGHWTPCVWVLRADHLDVHCWDVDGIDLNCLNRLHGLLGVALDLQSYQVFCTRRVFGSTLCGAAAIAFLASYVSGRDLPVDEAQLKALASEYRHDFHAFHSMLAAVQKPWCWGAGVEPTQVLTALLQLHGVPAAVSTQRSKLVMQSLGKDQVQQALGSVSPWKTLKQMANQAKPALQLVLDDELAAVIRAKQNTRPHGKQTKQQKQAKAMPSKPAEIDSTRLQLMPGSFCTASNVEVGQIPLSRVGPLATGIALVSFADALPFLQSGKKLTHNSLALLVINCPDDPQTQLDWSTLRFAATCALNQQPMLLSGVLVQLGNEPVCPYNHALGTATPEVPVACARLTVFKDQWPGCWDEFVAHPVKQLLAAVPALQSCSQQNCECGRWHPCQMEEASDVVLDVFRRQYYTDAGRPVKAAQASHFSVQIRFLKQQELAVLKHSGQQGIYIEPRQTDASAPSAEFQVVWMPQASLATVQHASQCEPSSIGIARSGTRYGIRVAAKHFQQVFQQLKPEGQFLAPGQRLNWHCGPWPFGTDRKMLARIFKDWQWQARPLQPAKAVEGGMMWLVQSVAEPSQGIWNMQHGQVLVSKCESATSNMSADAKVIGTQATVDLCTSTTTTDPWLIKDPWQRTLTQACPAGPAAATTSVATHLEAIEARLEKSILDKLPTGQMETDEQDTRIAQIESQLQHLAARHQSLEGIVEQHHQQNTVQVQNLQTQMMSQLEVQRSQMRSMFDDQMSRLETILSKKGRYE